MNNSDRIKFLNINKNLYKLHKETYNYSVLDIAARRYHGRKCNHCASEYNKHRFWFMLPLFKVKIPDHF